MPAARPACTPFGASSKTRTRSGAGAPPSKSPAATLKISGSGLDLVTWSPVTTWCISPNSSRWSPVFKSKCRRCEEVATAMGIPCLWRWRTKRSTPGIRAAFTNSASSSCSRSATNASAVIFPASPSSSIKISAASTAFLPIIFAFRSHVKVLPKRSTIFCWATVYALSVSNSRPSMSKSTCVTSGAAACRSNSLNRRTGKPSMDSIVPSSRSRYGLSCGSSTVKPPAHVKISPLRTRWSTTDSGKGRQ
mmetsp:Transcript_76715/g.211943  ORF Transcript_76715/g.211943 Transcript_76715/m.211943 type:complete len:249 (+) Transcript_76715:177-923(+)